MVINAAKPESARVRLLAAADELFYSVGIRTVGIDRLLERAGVAKGSLYYNFSGKDGLVRSYLLGRLERWSERVAAAIAAEKSPTNRILAVFGTLARLFAEPGYNGCAFANASAESTVGSAEREIVAQYRLWLHTLFVQLSIDIGASDPYVLADQLVLQYDGAFAASTLDRNPHAATAARATIPLLIGASLPRDSATGPVSASHYH